MVPSGSIRASRKIEAPAWFTSYWLPRIKATPDWFPKTVQGMYEWVLSKEIQSSDLLGKYQPWRRIPLRDDMPVNEYFFLRRTFKK